MVKLKDLEKEMEKEMEKVFTEDLVEDILMKSAVKSLMRCRCVCKKWLSLIDSPRFIDMHLKHSSRTNYILVTHSPRDRNHTLSILDYESLELINSVELEFPPLISYPLRICGPCNGLICLIDPRNEIMLYNPPMGGLKHLPPRLFEYGEGLKYDFMGFGFGFDSITRDYKVVVLVIFYPFEEDEDDDREDNVVGGGQLGPILVQGGEGRGQLGLVNVQDGEGEHSDVDDDLLATKVDIYDLSTNSWREIVFDGPEHLDDVAIYENEHGMFFNGAIHWTVCKEGVDIILSFDLSTEEFRDIQLPNDLLLGFNHYKTLAVLNDCLVLFACTFYNRNPENQFIDIWVMKEYGVKKSWTKQDRIGPLTGIHCALMMWKNKAVILETIRGQLLSCDLDTHEIREFNIQGARGLTRAMLFQESLVSLG